MAVIDARRSSFPAAYLLHSLFLRSHWNKPMQDRTRLALYPLRWQRGVATAGVPRPKALQSAARRAEVRGIAKLRRRVARSAMPVPSHAEWGTSGAASIRGNGRLECALIPDARGFRQLLLLYGDAALADVDLDAGRLVSLLVELITEDRGGRDERADDEVECVSVHGL